MRLSRWSGLGLLGMVLCLPLPRALAESKDGIQVHQTGDDVFIETDALKAQIRKKGYVSGTRAGTFLDKKTGAHDLGFGLHIMDFLMAPGWRDDGYPRDPKVHGHLPKHYVEGPQICTQAKELTPEVIRGKDFVAVRLRFRFTEAAKGLKPGSVWEQTLVFRPGVRYFLSQERITSVNDVDDLFYRIDMPGHVKHRDGDAFEQVYLSYHGKIPASEFSKNFAPDEKFLYQRQEGKTPDRMIRAYQVKANGKPGSWLAGMTLDPAETCEAWCHQRGYICFIEELHRRKVKSGETFGAAYVVGYFDDIAEMEKVYDQYKGTHELKIENGVLKLARAEPAAVEPLPETKPLRREGDLAAQMVAGIDKYLMRESAASVEHRKQYWKPEYTSPEAYAKSVQPNRERLRKILGVVDQRLPVKELQYVGSTDQPSLMAERKDYRVYAVRWPVLEGVDAEGLLLDPKAKAVACVVALPDADWTPEMLVGLAPAVPEGSQFARHLAENGCQVLVPTLIDRKDTWSGNPRIRMTNQTHREFIYRMAFEMGRHVIGYEVQKVLAAVDWFAKDKKHPPIGVFGYGEGGLLALYSSSLDSRIHSTEVSGYFGPREKLWQEPIYRNVWRLLHEFGDGELIHLVVPRSLFIEHANLKPPPHPSARDGRSGAAPGIISAPSTVTTFDEINRIRVPPQGSFPRRPYSFIAGAGLNVELGATPQLLTAPGLPETLDAFLKELDRKGELDFDGKIPAGSRKGFDPASRQHRQFDQLVAYTQKLMRDADLRRQEFFWSKVDTSSLDKWQASCRPLRDYLWKEVIGKLPKPAEPMNPHSRLVYNEPKWKGYEVTLDLYPDVFAYGILLLPKDLKPGERRPVVVCQHGLEGRPQDVVNPREKTKYYNSFGAQLADLGYIVYAPQNPYIGKDDFRVLQRKANPLGLSLFSFIVGQHERTLDWLATLPNVDPARMAFYGLSYGGKTAMRVPAILPRYALSICSGDFNEWIWKNVSVEFNGSYMFTGEYEMFEFDLGNTFNYAEMAALIAPRPFMVERGHDDGVGIDEWVAYEYAKVRRLYDKLGIGDRTAIEFFNGGHEIHSEGTFAFLKKHLHWPN